MVQEQLYKYTFENPPQVIWQREIFYLLVKGAIKMSSPPTLETLDVKIENVVKDHEEFRADIKEEIREIKTSVKDSEKIFNETIAVMKESIAVMKESIASMKENITWLTRIAEQQREELALIRETQSQPEEFNPQEEKWYQKNITYVIFLLGAIIIGLLGLDAGGFADIIK